MNMQAYRRPASLGFLAAVLSGGCGGEAGNKPQEIATPVLAAAGPVNRPRAQPRAAAAEPAVPAPASPEMVQMNSLPHLSALSERERAGLLMLLQNKTPAQRLALIEMYPSLAGLPVQQKEVLLDRLEKIVPLAAGQPR